MAPAPVRYALTFHVEGPRDERSSTIYEEIAGQVELADRLGYAAVWFAEHHAHAHLGHAPHPLLFALYLAARTEKIHLGSSVVCINLHHPVLLAEQMAMADVLSGGRMSIGVGSGSTPSEFALYGVEDASVETRRARFLEVLDLLETAWMGEPFECHGQFVRVTSSGLLPRPERDMREALWIGANSPDSAFLAGRRGYGLQLSNMRTIDELGGLVDAYRAGRADAPVMVGEERIAASAPIYVGADDESALAQFEPALDSILRDNRRSRPASAPGATPTTAREHLGAMRFTIGGPERCLADLLRLRKDLPFTFLNLRPRWAGLTPEQVAGSIERFMCEVRPRLDAAW